MKHGILSHHCCCGENLYTRHIVTRDSEGHLLAIEPFTEETANTTFCDELLIITACNFEKYVEQFSASIQQYYTNNGNSRITDLIMKNELYRNNMVQTGAKCHIYAISHIDKATLRPIDIEKVTLKKL